MMSLLDKPSNENKDMIIMGDFNVNCKLQWWQKY